jgi:hypothetical protein
MKLVTSAIFVLLLTPTSLAESDVSGSMGILVENGRHTPGGFFIEINKKSLGGYISVTGERPNDSYSIAHVSVGPTFIVKKRAGILLHLGFQEHINLNARRSIPLAKPSHDPPSIDDPPNGGNGYVYQVKRYYFTCGGGTFVYVINKFFILHVKYLYIPQLKESYIGFGFWRGLTEITRFRRALFLSRSRRSFRSRRISQPQFFRSRRSSNQVFRLGLFCHDHT